MALTPKQVRNGVPGAPGGEGGNVAQPGPAVTPPKAAAEAAGNAWQANGKQVFDGGGWDVGGVVDWDRNIAVDEGVGEV